MSVVSGLIVKYPCLKESDSVTGYDGCLKSWATTGQSCVVQAVMR